jgi:ribosomal protein S18 acetylase RimI-like enzyme
MTADFTCSVVEPADWQTLEEVAALDREAFTEDGLTPANLSLMARAGRIFVLREATGNMAAEAICLFATPTERIFLFSLAVSRSFRGKGLGTRLLRNMCTYFAREGFREMELTVAPDNHAALHLYIDSFKFSKVVLVKDHFGPGKDRWLVRGSLAPFTSL